MPTLIELLHPLKGKGNTRKDQVLAVLFFFKHYEDRPEATTSEVRAGLRRGRVPNSKKINVTDVLTKAAPLVDRVVRTRPGR